METITKKISTLAILLVLNLGVFAQVPPSNGIYPWPHTDLGTNWDTEDYGSHIFNGMWFRMCIPPDFDSTAVDGKTYPLFIFMHGRGEGGDDNNNQLKHGGRMVKDAINSGKFPGYAIYPQTTSGYWNDVYFDKIVELIDHMQDAYKIDVNRIYLNGLSAGGQGIWKFMGRHPKYVAAAHPMSAASIPFLDNLNDYIHVPMRLAQGGTDNAPHPNTAEQMVSAITNAGGDIEYFLYPYNGHNTWGRTWGEPDFWTWFLSHTKTSILVYHGDNEFCYGETISSQLGITAGFDAYEWSKDGILIPGATSNEYTATDTGEYTVRFLRDGVWTDWSEPVSIRYEDPSGEPDILTAPGSTTHLPGLDGSASIELFCEESHQNFEWRKVGSPSILGTGESFVATEAGDYTVTARKIGGCHDLTSAPFSVTVGSGVGSPDSPTNLIATAQSETEIRLSWDEDITPTFNETNFEIYRATSQAGPFSLIDTTSQDVSVFLDTELETDHTYYYQVRAVNAVGHSVGYTAGSATTLADTEAPTVPTGLTAIGGFTDITLSWNASEDNVGVTKYTIFQDGMPMAKTSETSFELIGLQNLALHTYTVRAQDLAGNFSPMSAQIVQAVAVEGLAYSYYEGVWDNLPDFNSLTPVKTGKTDNFDISLRDQNQEFAFKFDGFITVPVTGSYTFETRSDDGSKLYIGGFDEANLIVDNDGLHGNRERSGSIYLEAGPHPITVTFFELGGGQNLDVRWTVPGGSKEAIPSEVLKQEVLYPTPPLPPSGLAATPTSFDEITLTWIDDVADELGFEIWRSDNPGEEFAIIHTTNAGEESFVDESGIEPGQTYYYKIRSINANGASAFGGFGAQGVHYEYYEETVSKLNTPLFNGEAPVGTGLLSNFNLSPAQVSTGFGFVFTAKILISEAGLYRFYLASDDGSKLFINGSQLVYNDYDQGLTERANNITLDVGYHDIEIQYRQRGGGFGFDFNYRLPNTSVKIPLPDNVLFQSFVEATALPLPSAPPVPGNVAASPISSTSIELTWDDPSGPVDAFEIYRSAGGNTNYKLFATVDNPAGVSNSLMVDNLFANTVYAFQVKALNAGGTSELSTEVMSTTLNTAPEFSSMLPILMRYETTKEVVIDAMDVDNDDLAYTSIMLPSFGSFLDNGDGTATITLTPTIADVGVHPISISVDDGFGGTDILVTSVEVDDNFAPTIGSISDLVIDEGQSTSILFNVEDVNGETLTFTIPEELDFVTIVDNGNGTGTLTAAPFYADQGVYTDMEILVSDPNGAYDQTSFSITVNDVEVYNEIKINFNQIYFDENWITTFSPSVGKVLENMVNQNGVPTDIDLTMTNAWGGAYRFGAITGNNSGVYPDNVIHEFFYFSSGSPEFEITGLDPNLVYDFTFFASSTFSAGETKYTIGSQEVSLEVSGNQQNTAKLTGISPEPDGSLTITFSKDASVSFGYINALVIESFFDDGNAPETPSNLALTPVQGQGVELTWSDNSASELSQTVFRSVGDETNYTPIAALDADVTSFLDTDIIGNTTYFYQVSAGNTNGSSPLSESVTITAPNSVPVITPVADAVILASDNLQLNISASDIEGHDLTISAVSLPGFAALNDLGSGNGTLTFAPNIVDLGSYDVVYSVTDEFGAVGYDTMMVSVADNEKRSIFINFNKNFQTVAPAPWNNVDVPFNGKVTQNMVDELGLPTNVSMTQQSTWGGTGLSGAINGDDGGVFPDNPAQSYYFFGSGYGANSQTLLFSGLNPSNKYNFIFFGSSSYTPSGALNGSTEYTIGGETVTLDVQNNAYESVQINGVVPDGSGNVTVTVNMGAGALFGYLNAMEIIEFTELQKPAKPADLSARATSRDEVLIEWTDASDNETNFEIYRAATGEVEYTYLTSVGAGTESYIDASVNSDETYGYQVRAVNGAGASSFTTSVMVNVPMFEVYININGFASHSETSPWNNLERIPNTGDEYYNLLDDNGLNRGVGLLMDQTFTGEGRLGTNTGTNSGVYPDKIMESFYYLNAGEPGRWIVGNLDPNLKYNFHLFGAITLGTTNLTMFTINGETKGLVTQYNEDYIAEINGVSPDANGEIWVDIISGPEAQWGIMNGMVIQAYSENGSLPSARFGETNIFAFDMIDATEQGMTLFPNPLVDEEVLSINYEEPASQVHVQVLDMNGNEVYADLITPYGFGSQIDLDTRGLNLNNGLFIVKVTADEFGSKAVKFLKK